MKILGVTFSSSFTFDKHVDIICSRARQAQYAIRVLASHGLSGQRLHDVVRSTLVAGLIYSSPSWWGFDGAADRVRLQAVLTRIGRLGYLPEDTPSTEQICSKADTFCLGMPQPGTRAVSPSASEERVGARPAT